MTSHTDRRAARAPQTVLCLDTASPTVSVAAAVDGQVLGEEREPIARSSVRLLPMIDAVLRRAGLPQAGLAGLSGLVVLAGPGSFTGLRVGMATALGLHQASGVAATSVPSFAALAAWRLAERSAEDGGGEPVLAAVDVLRGEWAVQAYRPADGEAAEIPARLRAEGEPRRLAAAELVAEAGASGATIVGFGTAALDTAALDTAGSAVEPDALAGPAAAALSLLPPRWDPAALTRPLYFRPPAVSMPKAPRSA